MIKATESAGASTRRGMRCGESVLRGRAMEISPTEAAATTESTSGSIEVIAIDEHSAVGYIAVGIQKDIVVMPIRSPVVPTPTEPSKEADSQAETPCQPCPAKLPPPIPLPPLQYSMLRSH